MIEIVVGGSRLRAGREPLHPATVLDFPFEGAVWAVVEPWAQAAGLVLETCENLRRVYRRRSYWVVPVIYEITQEGARVTIRGYVEKGALPQMELRSGGFYGVLARNAGRKTLNVLLAQLGQPPLR